MSIVCFLSTIELWAVNDADGQRFADKNPRLQTLNEIQTLFQQAREENLNYANDVRRDTDSGIIPKMLC